MIRDNAPVRINWRFAAAGAVGLSVLFAIQNDIAPPVARPDLTLGDHVLLQLIVWFGWLALLPMIFGIARRAREHDRVTFGLVVAQIADAALVSLLHAALTGTVRWLLGVSYANDLGTVILTSISTGFAANFIRYWLIAGVYYAIAYHREVRERDAREARYATSLAEARLENLEGRLHPHFLFNTLNAIAALIRDDPKAAERMVENLSELLRAALSAEPGREVPLERELELLRQYVAIQQARFRDRLRVVIEADDGTRTALVPQLILQPLVENAIRHGIAPREAEGTVLVRAERHGDALRLSVDDDGVGFSASARGERTGLGLDGTRGRLRHLYGDRATLTIDPRTPSGTTVSIELPFRTSREPVAESVA